MGQYDIIEVLKANKKKWFTRYEIENLLPNKARCNTTLLKLRTSGFFVKAKRYYDGNHPKGFLYKYKAN